MGERLNYTQPTLAVLRGNQPDHTVKISKRLVEEHLPSITHSLRDILGREGYTVADQVRSSAHSISSCRYKFDTNSTIMDADRLRELLPLSVEKRLNQVDKLKANGIGNHIALPQLVVCGAQSAGKSSVLEGITGIPFPRQDGLCTRFATEIILRHAQCKTSITASINPHSGRHGRSAKELRKYRRCLKGYDELPEVIKDAAERMGIDQSSASRKNASAFTADVLRIEVVGEVGLSLTTVDLPGLISVENDEHGKHDIEMVEGLVDSYLRLSRTIILAVVQATSDIVTQPIIQRARNFDKNGSRAVGIVTKPDLVNRGTEGRIALLTKNGDTTKLKLGFFLLKNPSPKDLAKGITGLERRRQEITFFQSPEWKKHGLDMSRIGIDSLRPFLQRLLGRHIEVELPKVCKEIYGLLEETQEELGGLRDERSSLGHHRLFLSNLAMNLWDSFKLHWTGHVRPKLQNFLRTRMVRSRLIDSVLGFMSSIPHLLPI